MDDFYSSNMSHCIFHQFSYERRTIVKNTYALFSSLILPYKSIHSTIINNHVGIPCLIITFSTYRDGFVNRFLWKFLKVAHDSKTSKMH